MSDSPHQPVMNTVAWLLTVAGAIGFVAAAAGSVYILLQPRSRIISSETSLHDTYYVIVHSKMQIWPLLLCMALSAAIAVIGYSRTDRFVRRMLRPMLEQADKT